MASDWFGSAVQVKGSTIAISSYNGSDENGAGNVIAGAGSVFIYKKTNSTWSFSQKIVAQGTNARNSGDVFGSYLSLTNGLLLMSSNNGYDELGQNYILDAGSFFVFKEQVDGTWVQDQKIIGYGPNSRRPNSTFGDSVAVSDNGSSDGFTIGIGDFQNSYTTQGTTPFSEFAGLIYTFF